MWLVGIVVCLGWIFSLCLHEFSHALVAYWGGDTSVKNKGYLTFNLLKYTDPGYSIILPLLFLFIGGIGLPGGAVYIHQHRLRNRWWKSAVSAAGPLANILLALLLSIPFWIYAESISAIPDSIDRSSFLLSSLAFVVYLQVFAAIFNLLPIPGLDGYGIIEFWLPIYIQTQGKYIRKYSTLIIIGLFWYAPWFNILIFRAIRFFTSQILRVPEFLVDDGSSLFRQPINKAIALSILMMIGWGLSSPKNTWNQNQKGQILIKKKQYQAAIAIFNRSIEIDPDSEEAWSQKAYCLWCLNLEDRAIESFRKVLEIDPDNEYAQMSIGKIYFVHEEYH